MAELADAHDSKSCGGNTMGVRFPLSAPMIELHNGHRFSFMTASGALGYDGKGWPWEKPLYWTKILDPTKFTNVTRTLTLKPEKGNLKPYNPFGVIRLLKDGAVNAVGLNNPGINYFCDQIAPHINKNIPIIPSIFGEPQELAIMTEKLNRFDFKGLEINASCPNTKTDILNNSQKIIDSCLIVREKTNLPIILKLSAAHNIKTIIPPIENIIDAISINSVPWNIIYPNKESPLKHLGGGGVSGKLAQEINWNFMQEIIDISPTPVIAPSIWDTKDIEITKNMGAKAFSFGTRFLLAPWAPNQIISSLHQRN